MYSSTVMGAKWSQSICAQIVRMLMPLSRTAVLISPYNGCFLLRSHQCLKTDVTSYSVLSIMYFRHHKNIARNLHLASS